jgi:hypothetical protein
LSERAIREEEKTQRRKDAEAQKGSSFLRLCAFAPLRFSLLVGLDARGATA